jgi:cysteinyl-tRNA synthetase
MLGLLGALSFGLAQTWRAAASTRRELLRGVARWGAQYQNIDLDAVAASDLDLVVLEPSLDDYYLRFIQPAEVERLKRKPGGGRRIVLAYLPVGETDTKRWYWPQEWREAVPEWVGPDNPDWPGSRHVRFWHPQWRGLVFEQPGSLLDRILDAGYDGALLDRVDAYFDWEGERPSAQDDMIDMIVDIRRKVEARRPDFILMPQNAEHLMLHPRYLRLIDAVNKESLLSGLDGENRLNKPDDVSWSLEHLRLAEKEGVVIFVTEYATAPDIVVKLAAKVAKLGFRPFMGARALDRLPS